MPLQTKRNDELTRQVDEVFDIPDLNDKDKDRFLGKNSHEEN
ncbi:hypothetical protein [Weissella bombi]|uniref:Uncharacterized protein n=1 Tax=Weissella bombi TaxID=1505725 RepID=A0A1C4BQN2_9LACO|nr:hypothetical protein [Weissella bombi]SCC09167.1 hypothetical protein GA0061074_11411 [Weissella bombi]